MNRLPATLVGIEREGSIALAEGAVAGRRYTALLVGMQEVSGWQTGSSVTLMFKETEVSLAKNLSGLLSLRNRFPATVTRIERGRLLTKVMLDFEGHVLASIITTRAADALGLAVGDNVEGLVKANEMTMEVQGAG